MSKPTIIDFFCGAGGFSEGFRQQGFEIVLGVDRWDSAIRTFNYNFDLNCSVKNILDYENSIVEIDLLPIVDVIIGSPPCVTFSNSNRSGKADKSMGVRLTEVLLRIIAVQRHRPNSRLKAWFIENVPNSAKYLKEYYTFRDLNLSNWARRLKINPNKKAIVLKNSQHIINSADFGSPQIRKRVISGEIVGIRELPIPVSERRGLNSRGDLPKHVTLKEIRRALPEPKAVKSRKLVRDPLYPTIRIKSSDLTDHFYDTGLYECIWKQSKFLKTNHPYMGRMSFPENEDKPSRTITATNIGTSREAIIYRSEYDRKGNGEYRTPTIRESACLMGFPITFQFLGTEGVKSRLVGNAVCPSVSRAFAKLLRKEMGLDPVSTPILKQLGDLSQVDNLNTYSKKVFRDPPKRSPGARFRRHPFKDGNMTVTLSNYHIDKGNNKTRKWITSVQYGNGEGFPTHNFPNGFYMKIEKLVAGLNNGSEFLSKIENGFTNKIGTQKELQAMYENQKSMDGLLEPSQLVEEVRRIINQLDIEQKDFAQNDLKVFKFKETVPMKQLFALYALNKVASLANSQ